MFLGILIEVLQIDGRVMLLNWLYFVKNVKYYLCIAKLKNLDLHHVRYIKFKQSVSPKVSQ